MEKLTGFFEIDNKGTVQGLIPNMNVHLDSSNLGESLRNVKWESN